ncbi:hypothetical protein [Frankia sp. ArI3]|uniref:hypothetical protein n=1 Tax=Frankia sp. ArI3 TaxID=1858 RepID=UPI0005D110F8|nr:hypothetical protein [Frankia sp. ArI3]
MVVVDEDGPRAGFCNAKVTRQGVPGWCRKRSGAGTSHLGSGHCRFHAGETPSGRYAAARERFEDDATRMVRSRRVRFGEVIPTNPMFALADEVGRSVAFVMLVEDEIRRNGGAVDGDDVQLVDTVGTADGGTRTEIGVLIRLWREERAHLAKVAKTTIDAGVIESQERFVNAYQEKFIGTLEGVVGDLGLDVNDPQVVGVISRRLGMLAAPSSPVGIGGSLAMPE